MKTIALATRAFLAAPGASLFNDVAEVPTSHPLSKVATPDIWTCALKAEMAGYAGMGKDDGVSVAWVEVVEETEATWTVALRPKSQYVTAERLTKSLNTFVAYLTGYGRQPIVRGNLVTIAKSPKNVVSG